MSAKYVVCINNGEWLVSLEVGKIYRALPDDDAATFNWIRVIDESGEDYLFPSSCFVPIELPAEVEQALCATASWGGHLVQPAPQWNVVG